MSCKGCSASFKVANEDIEKLVAEQLALEIDLVDDDTYEERLKICENCPSLANETTCQHCGCFVQFRAKLAYKKCPYPAGAKW